MTEQFDGFLIGYTRKTIDDGILFIIDSQFQWVFAKTASIRNKVFSWNFQFQELRVYNSHKQPIRLEHVYKIVLQIIKTQGWSQHFTQLEVNIVYKTRREDNRLDILIGENVLKRIFWVKLHVSLLPKDFFW